MWVHICNFSYLRSGGRGILISKLAQAKVGARLCFKNKIKKRKKRRVQGHSSSDKVLA
jgi:hypothetical protein